LSESDCVHYQELSHEALSRVVVIKNIKESVTLIQSDSVERRLSMLTAAVDQLLQHVQVRLWHPPADMHVISSQ